MRASRIFLSLFLATTCLGQLSNVNLKSLSGMQFTNRTHRLARGLVAYWPMNERSGNKVFDLSGNGNTGVLSGDVAWISGPSGPSLTFPGSNDWIDISDDNLPAFGTNDFTVVIRAKHPQDGAHRMLLTKGQTGSGEFELYKQNSDRTFFYGDGGSISCSFGGTDSFPDDVWVHIAVVRRGSKITVYQDNVTGNSNTSAGGDLNTATNWRIGADPTGYGDWTGEIDYVMIYNRALSAGERALLYQKGDSWMFQRSDIELMAKSVAAPPAGGGQLIFIQTGVIPLVFITAFCFVMGRKNV